MEAQIALSGNIGTEIEFVSGEGWNIARFRLGSTPRWRKGEEWVNGETTWISVRASGYTALNIRDSLRKGDPVLVIGRLRTRSWIDEEGVKQERLVVEATSLGHDLSRGVSSYSRPERAISHQVDDEPLGPDEPLQPVASADSETAEEL